MGSAGIAGSDPSEPADPDGRSKIGGTDVYLKYRPLSGGSTTIVSLQAEWFYRRRDVVVMPPGIGRETLHDTGGFAALFWRFAQRWATAARWELGTPSRNGAGVVTPHCGMGEGTTCADFAFIDNVQRVSANLTFWPTEFSRSACRARRRYRGRARYRVVGPDGLRVRGRRPRRTRILMGTRRGFPTLPRWTH